MKSLATTGECKYADVIVADDEEEDDGEEDDGEEYDEAKAKDK